jgi:hypothetical protein
MVKTYTLDDEEIAIVKALILKSSVATSKGQVLKETPIIDKDGTWVQVEILTGPNKGNRKPTVMEKLS